MEKKKRKKKETRQNGQQKWAQEQGEDRKVESNGSPEIPDRRETSDIPGLPSGVLRGDQHDPAASLQDSSHQTTSHLPTSLQHYLFVNLLHDQLE